MVVREGSNLTLMCKATGYPEPYVMWRREDGEEMSIAGQTGNGFVLIRLCVSVCVFVCQYYGACECFLDYDKGMDMWSKRLRLTIHARIRIRRRARELFVSLCHD